MVTEKSQQDNKVYVLAKKNEVGSNSPEALKPSSKPSLQRQKQQLC